MDSAVELTQVIRQVGSEQAAFRDNLVRIAEGAKTKATCWNLLHERITISVGAVERQTFGKRCLHSAAADWN